MALDVTEKDVERWCDELIRELGGKVVAYSQPFRAAQTSGIQDREYFVFDSRIRFEIKKPDGKLTQSQFDLLTQYHAVGDVCAAGGVQELKHTAAALRRSKGEARELGWLFVELWAARGFRRESKSRSA